MASPRASGIAVALNVDELATGEAAGPSAEPCLSAGDRRALCGACAHRGGNRFPRCLSAFVLPPAAALARTERISGRSSWPPRRHLPRPSGAVTHREGWEAAGRNKIPRGFSGSREIRSSAGPSLACSAAARCVRGTAPSTQTAPRAALTPRIRPLRDFPSAGLNAGRNPVVRSLRRVTASSRFRGGCAIPGLPPEFPI